MARCLRCSLPQRFLRSRPVTITEATEERLSSLLEARGIDVSSFGAGESKPLCSLVRELNEGSCRLEVERSSGKLCRYVEPVFVQLRYGDMVLVERGRVQPTGKRRQNRTLLAEKREPSDPGPFEAALRAIREKLHVEADKNLNGLVHNVMEDVTFTDKRDSASYPGIPAVYLTHYVHLVVKERSSAEAAFKDCGLPGCAAFETQEEKQSGIVQLNWEWVNIQEARVSGVKGFPGDRNRRGSLCSLDSTATSVSGLEAATLDGRRSSQSSIDSQL